MLEATETAIGFMKNRERPDLDQNRMLLFAVIRAIEILGEAANRVSPETRARYPEIPWRAATAMRNRLIHGYFDIDKDVVWSTVTGELPALGSLLTKVLNSAK
ncbi:DUF86 domain-containing protein [Sedimenticola hydrogenitrophicus]|uniref:HepT-like ribonuclease domain-containing protein n=1 Tax=Sedimenticola hydrogenitrophicus TaxID=2967975 RepID=UPI0023B1927F|nr:DUF86 domain-containing protein [Sedimenticola hydrogenitrophicus]